VNCIAPGLIRTDMAKPLVKMVEKSSRYPNALKIIGEPEDIAGMALLLASEAGRYATGQNLRHRWWRAGDRSDGRLMDRSEIMTANCQ
jgi:NAD(P)-dependent dehydrogenase (short-subunit alcohol dehydrogenase family)